MPRWRCGGGWPTRGPSPASTSAASGWPTSSPSSGPADGRRGPGADLRDHRLVGVRRADRSVRTRPPRRLRAVRRRTRRRHGPADPARHHHPRPDPHQCGVLAAGRARSRERVAAPGSLLGAAGVLRREPADAERDPAQAGAARPAARGQLAEHDGVPGRRHRRPAGRWRPDPRARLLVALPGGHGHAAGHPVRGGEAAEAAGRVAHRPGGLAVGDRRVPLPARPPRAAHVVPGRHHRDGLRDAARAVPGSRPRRLRRTRERWPRLRAAVRRYPCGRRARRDLLRLGLARASGRVSR